MPWELQPLFHEQVTAQEYQIYRCINPRTSLGEPPSPLTEIKTRMHDRHGAELSDEIILAAIQKLIGLRVVRPIRGGWYCP